MFGRCNAMLASSVSPDRDQILVLDRANVTDRKFNQRLRPPRRAHELDLKPVRLVDLDHGAEVSLTQAMLREIPLQNDRIEIVKLHAASSGKAVMNLGKSSSCLTIQTVCSEADRPEGPVRVPRTSYLFPKRVKRPGVAESSWAKSRRSLAKSRPVRLQIAKRDEERGFHPAHWMTGRQEIVANLLDIDDRVLGLGKFHRGSRLSG